MLQLILFTVKKGKQLMWVESYVATLRRQTFSLNPWMEKYRNERGNIWIQKSRGPPGPDFKMEAFQASWLCPSCLWHSGRVRWAYNAHAHASDEVKKVTNKRMNKAILVCEMNETGWPWAWTACSTSTPLRCSSASLSSASDGSSYGNLWHTLTNGQKKEFLATLVALHCTPVGRSFELAQFRGLLACLVSLQGLYKCQTDFQDNSHRKVPINSQEASMGRKFLSI